MRAILISDQHGWLPELPEGDLLIVAGDFSPIENHQLDFQRGWAGGIFAEWLSSQPFRNKIGICGNHDFIGEDDSGRQILSSLDWHYLEGGGVEVEGLKVWGDPWCPPCGRWAFMAKDPMLEERYAKIPQGIDLLITHGPARGTGDQVVSHQRVGSQSLARHIERIQPALHVCGHIHEDRGRRRLDHGSSDTVSINASLLDHRYQPWGWCWQLDLVDGPQGWQVPSESITELPLSLDNFPRRDF